LEDLLTYITNNKNKGDKMSIGILRDGKTQELEVTLEAKPKDLRR
jgi:hypothetical protein